MSNTANVDRVRTLLDRARAEAATGSAKDGFADAVAALEAAAQALRGVGVREAGSGTGAGVFGKPANTLVSSTGGDQVRQLLQHARAAVELAQQQWERSEGENLSGAGSGSVSRSSTPTTNGTVVGQVGLVQPMKAPPPKPPKPRGLDAPIPSTTTASPSTLRRAATVSSSGWSYTSPSTQPTAPPSGRSTPLTRPSPPSPATRPLSTIDTPTIPSRPATPSSSPSLPARPVAAAAIGNLRGSSPRASFDGGVGASAFAGLRAAALVSSHRASLESSPRSSFDGGTASGTVTRPAPPSHRTSLENSPRSSFDGPPPPIPARRSLSADRRPPSPPPTGAAPPPIPPRRSMSADRRPPTPTQPAPLGRPGSAASIGTQATADGVEDHLHIAAGLARVRGPVAVRGIPGTGMANPQREQGRRRPKVPGSPLLRFHGELQRQLDVVAAEMRTGDLASAASGGGSLPPSATSSPGSLSPDERLRALKEAHAAIQMGQGRVIALMDLARRTSLLDLRPAVLARVLASIDQHVFLSVRPSDIVYHRPPKNPSERLQRSTDLFNFFSRAVEASILEQPLASMRARAIHHWAEVCGELWRCRCMQALKAITSAMTTPPIARLRATWSVVPARSLKALAEYKNVLSEEHNYWSYREWAGRNAVRPAVPFLGVYIQDVYYLAAVVKKEVGTDDPEILLGDTRVAEVVERVAWYQQGQRYQHVMRDGKGQTVDMSEMFFGKDEARKGEADRLSAGETELGKRTSAASIGGGVVASILAAAAAAPAALPTGGMAAGERTSMYQMLMGAVPVSGDRSDIGGAAREVLHALLRAIPGAGKKGSGGPISGTVEDGLKEMDGDQMAVFVAHWVLTREWLSEQEVDELSAQREPKLVGEEEESGWAGAGRPLSGLDEYSERGERRSWILKKMMRDVATRSWSGEGDDDDESDGVVHRTRHSMVEGLIGGDGDGKKSKRWSRGTSAGKEDRRSLSLFGIGKGTGSGTGHERISSASEGSTTLVESTRDSGASGHSSVSSSSGISPASSRPNSTMGLPNRLSTASSADDVHGPSGKRASKAEGDAPASKPGQGGAPKPFAYLSADQLGMRKVGSEHRRAATVGESAAMEEVTGAAHLPAAHKPHRMSAGVRFADAGETRDVGNAGGDMSPTRSPSADSVVRALTPAATPPLPARVPPTPSRGGKPTTVSIGGDVSPKSSMPSSMSLGNLSSRAKSPPPDLPARRMSALLSGPVSPPVPRLPPRTASPKDSVAMPSEPPQVPTPIPTSALGLTGTGKPRGPLGDPNAALAQILAQRQAGTDSADDLALRRRSTLKRIGQ